MDETPLLSAAGEPAVTPASQSASGDLKVVNPLQPLSSHLGVPAAGQRRRASTAASITPSMSPSFLDESDSVTHARKSRPRHSKSVEITVGDLVRYLTKDVHKTRQSLAAPLYGVFLAFFTTLVVIETIDSENSHVFFRDYGTRLQLEAAPEAYLTSEEPEDSMFDKVNGYDSLYNWLEAALLKVWPAGSLDTAINEVSGMTWTGPETEAADPTRVNLPVGFILLRQFRVTGSPCGFEEQLNAIPSSLRAGLNFTETCYPPYTTEALSIEPYPSKSGNINWTSNVLAEKGSFVNSIPRTGIIHSYASPTKAYSILFPVDRPFRGNISVQLRELREEGWIDSATRAVFLEVITFNQGSDSFSFNSFLVEILATNNYVPSHLSIPFHYLTLWSPTRYIVLIFDIFSICFVIFDFCQFIYRMKSDRELQDDDGGFFAGIGFWGFFQCAMLGQFLAAYYYRGQLWYYSWGIDESYFEVHQWEIIKDFTKDGQFSDVVPPEQLEEGQVLWAWWRLARYAYLFNQWSTMIAVALILVWLRVFSFVQYYDQWNILTATINVAAGDLFGVLALGVVVVLGFGISAHILYGDDLEDFRHLRHSVGALLRTLVSGEVPQFNEMLQLHRWETRVLVLLYYILAWLILLNMILAIITGSFSSVQEGMQGQGQGGDYLKLLLEKIGGCRGRGKERGDVDVEDEGASKAGEPKQTKEKKKGTEYIRNRIKAVMILRKKEAAGQFREAGYGEGEGGSFIGKDDFVEKVCYSGGAGLTDKEVSRVFDNASKEASASNRSVKQGEKWAQGITESLEKVRELSGAIARIEESTSKIPEALGIEEGLQARLQQIKEKLHAFTLSTSNLEAFLDAARESAKPLPEFSHRIGRLCDSMREAAPATAAVMHQLHQQTLEIRPTLLRIERSLNKWTERLMEDIKRGTLWGPPTLPALGKALPRLQKQKKGKGVVASVKSYAYTGYYPTTVEEGLGAESESDDGQEKAVHFGGEHLDAASVMQRPADPVGNVSKVPAKGILKGQQDPQQAKQPARPPPIDVSDL